MPYQKQCALRSEALAARYLRVENEAFEVSVDPPAVEVCHGRLKTDSASMRAIRVSARCVQRLHMCTSLYSVYLG